MKNVLSLICMLAITATASASCGGVAQSSSCAGTLAASSCSGTKEASSCGGVSAALVERRMPIRNIIARSLERAAIRAALRPRVAVVIVTKTKVSVVRPETQGIGYTAPRSGRPEGICPPAVTATDHQTRQPYDFEKWGVEINALQSQRTGDIFKDAEIEAKQMILIRKIIGPHANWF